MVQGFQSELKAGIITSATDRACPLWYGHKKTHKIMLADSNERFSFGTMVYTFSENLPLAFLKVKSLQSSIDLLLILEQCYNNDTAALANFRGKGA